MTTGSSLTTAYYNGMTWRNYAYDDEGQITGIDNGYATYTYDAMGNRVRKDSGGAWTEYIGFGGLAVAEKNSDGSWSDYIFANGARIAKASSVNALTPASSTIYYHGDQIGSTRMVTNGSGSVVSTNEFYPYGQGPQATTQNHYLFSGKERDIESGLDYFGARYYLSGIGRFMSADWSAQADPVPYAKLDDPRTLNLYAYVRNNPISLVDPDGHLPNDGFGSHTLYNPIPEAQTNVGSNEMLKALSAQNEQYLRSAIGFIGVTLANQRRYAQELPHPVTTVTVDGGDVGCDPSNAACSIRTNYIFFYYALRNYGSPVTNTSSNRNNAPSNANQSSWQQKMRQVSHYMCGKSPGDRVAKSVLTGAGFGAVAGAIGGFVAGEVFGGEVTLGATGFVGAYLGAHVGAAVGAANGLATGAALAGICYAGFQYDN